MFPTLLSVLLVSIPAATGNSKGSRLAGNLTRSSSRLSLFPASQALFLSDERHEWPPHTALPAVCGEQETNCAAQGHPVRPASLISHHVLTLFTPGNLLSRENRLLPNLPKTLPYLLLFPLLPRLLLRPPPLLPRPHLPMSTIPLRCLLPRRPPLRIITLSRVRIQNTSYLLPFSNTGN